ncbi:peptide ABC transporter substrate-binding protein [Indiicoccus explosivorum]|uniref:peptide ABC transporter substrate-binding protein n=1 Tax=Indiicoccus explosivorum TaxID=1917864 RepID=UPI000B446137|nr:peptide ABC transporter substrate-binding protein [Indiicoccus explosivorum]
MKSSKIFWLLGLVLVLGMFLAACGDDAAAPEEDVEETDVEEPVDEEEPAEEAPEEEATEFVPAEEVPELDEPQVLNLMEGAEIPSLDTSLSTDAVSFNILGNVNEGLYRLSPDNVPVPAVAAEPATISEDGLTYTFKLRDDAVWSDGTPVTAQDFVYSWQRSIDPATGSSYGPYMMSGVIANASEIAAGELEPSELGVTAIDDKTLEVQLERPTPYFESLMSFPLFFPLNQEFVEAQGDAFASNSDALLYNGPFTLENWDGTGLSWSLAKNENYWNADTVNLDEIKFDVVKETSTAINLYQSGEKDRTGLSGEFAMQYANDPNLITELEPTLFYLKFNQERNGEPTPLANENIRQAIAMGFNKQDLTDVILANGSLPADYLVPTDFAFNEEGEDFRDINGDVLGYDPEAALEAWEAGLEELGVEEITLELLGGDSELAKKMDEYLKAQLEENLPGLTIELRQVPFAVRLEADEAQDYDIQNAGWAPDYQDPMTFIDLFVTDGAHNKMSYSNPEFDALVEAAKTELALDPAARWEAMAEAERILLEDAGIAPIYQRGTMSLQKPYVHNLVSHPFGSDYSYQWAYIDGKE